MSRKEQGEKRLAIVTMGCRVNQCESEWLQRCGGERGYHPITAGETADLVVINTCAVTGESDRQARQEIRRAVKNHPGARVVVTGCSAQHAPQQLAAIPGVKLVLGNGEKNRLWEFLDEESGASEKGRVHADQPDPVDAPLFLPFPATPLPRERAMAYLRVQTGCDERCTFCLIPSLRGSSHSAPKEMVLSQAQQLIAEGYQELVLTGINLGAYGRDMEPPQTLAALVEALLALPGLGRLRLSSLDPADIDEHLLTLFSHADALCSHLHLSVQSGDNRILKRMHRRYQRELVLERVTRLRQARPGLVCGADLIVGFPTESDEAFEQTMQLVQAADLALLHIFRYSDRPGTSAAAIPARFRVPDEVMRRRSEQLRELGRALLQRTLQEQVGETVELLVESIHGGEVQGKSARFLPISLPAVGGEKPGQLLQVRVTGVAGDGSSLRGMALSGS